MITLTRPLNATLVHGITGQRIETRTLEPGSVILRFHGSFPDTLSGTVYSFLVLTYDQEFWYETHESELCKAGIEPPTTFDTFG